MTTIVKGGKLDFFCICMHAIEFIPEKENFTCKFFFGIFYIRTEHSISQIIYERT
jgi:hypothetical protein